MKIVITGRHLGVTESMKAYAREKVEKLRRYFDRATRARVTMEMDGDGHVVEIMIDLVRGQSLLGKAEAPDMYAALDLAEQKIAQQLRRFNQRLKDRHARDRRISAAGEGLRPRRGGAKTPPAEPLTTYEDVIDELKRGE